MASRVSVRDGQSGGSSERGWKTGSCGQAVLGAMAVVRASDGQGSDRPKF
jgi:hypothetical protein